LQRKRQKTLGGYFFAAPCMFSLLLYGTPTGFRDGKLHDEKSDFYARLQQKEENNSYRSRFGYL